jgi:hypothetical protein
MFGGAPPAPAPAPRRRKAAAGRPASSPAAEPQVMQAEPQTTNLPTCEKSQTVAPGPTVKPEKLNIVGRQYGLVTLHDGRQVDSGREEWRRETLARHLLTMAPPERDDWLAGWSAEAATEMRLLMRAMRSVAPVDS